MNALLIGGNDELSATLGVILRVRWRELELDRISDAREAVARVGREEPSIVFVALDEVAACCDLIARVRAFSTVPLVVIGETADASFKVRALESGADDWIGPGSIPMEFIARVHALLRRCSAPLQREVCSYCNGHLSIDFSTQEARIDGRQAELTPTEFKVLCHLARHEGSIVTRERLLGELCGALSSLILNRSRSTSTDCVASLKTTIQSHGS